MNRRTQSFPRRWGSASLTALLLLLGAVAPWSLSAADENLDAVWTAVESNNPRALRRLLPTVDANVDRDSDGHSPLTLAASRNSFECVRELLWSGALADKPNGNGRVAKQYLQPSKPGFLALNLLLRCHAFGQREGKVKARSGVPHRVLVIDTFVDPEHPDYAGHYWFNEAEREGTAGVDDDENGFIDDVSGWNLEDDEPQEVPQFGLSPAVKTDWLQQLLDDVSLISRGSDDGSLKKKLETRYDNPIFKQVGRRLAASGGLSLNDFSYGKLIKEASHGVHVTGIVFANSHQKAELHAAAFYGYSGAKEGTLAGGFRKLEERIQALAPKMKDYQSYVKAIRDGYLEGRAGVGRRFSDYIKSVDCGVVNMSYSEPQKVFKRLADLMRSEYQSRGADPKSIDTYKSPAGMDLGADLAVELQVAFAASYALAFSENPDVLFVIAAGNENEDVDERMSLPAFISRFFPNVLTVASVGRSNALSSFSNRGARSVQVAAMGEKVMSSFLGGIQGEMSGTSMATPAVAGIAARVRASHPKLSATDVRRLILASAVPMAGLRGKVSTGGVADGDQAIQMARNWQTEGHLFVDEPWDWPSTGNQPAIAKQTTPPSDGASETSKLSGPMFQAKPHRGIVSLGGFQGAWRVVTSTGNNGAQHFITSKEWPGDWMGSNRKQGFAITSMAGDSGGWAVAMSKVPSLTSQCLVGYDFDQTQLKANMEKGYRIRSLAGFGEKWVIAMDQATGYGRQRYTMPGSFDEARVDWIKARWDEGYRMTSVVGTEGKDESNHSWVVVMSENSGITAQGYRGPGEWPTKWIEEKWNDGYAITSVSGHGIGFWVVVMSKVTGQRGLQSYSGKLDSPESWIDTKWNTPPAPAKVK